MLSGIDKKKMAIGMKQSVKAVAADNVEYLVTADNVELGLLDGLLADCKAKNIPVKQMESMAQLGRTVGIDVGCAVVAVLKETL